MSACMRAYLRGPFPLLGLAFVCCVCSATGPRSGIAVDERRVLADLEHLATLNDLRPPAVQRLVFTRADVRARAFLRALMVDAGLSVREDALGNMFGRWGGGDGSGGRAVASGSHYDAIPYSGMYDGTLGVLGAVEALRALKRAGFRPLRPIEVIAFTSEEPTRFGIGCMGSRAMVGAVSPERLAAYRDGENVTLDAARKAVGYKGPLSSTLLGEAAYSAFIELHIEQGPVLEAQRTDIGVVSAIAAPASATVEFVGQGGHAGGQLMPLRNDAGLAGAEFALAVEAAALSTGSNDTVATCGRVEIFPGAVNSVPRIARIGIDVRDTDLSRRNGVLRTIEAAAAKIGEQRKVKHTFTMINEDDPATCAPAIVGAIEEAANALGLTSLHMVSRAYHDTLFMAQKFPSGMIFVPCRGGYSHRPDEFASLGAIRNGVAVLAHTLAQLAGQAEASCISDEL